MEVLYWASSSVPTAQKPSNSNSVFSSSSAND